MSKIIGYMEGTDPVWLTTLQVLGYSALPISNGYDGHGLNIQLINEQRKADMIVAYLHKIIPTPDVDTTPNELLYRTTLYQIPVLIVCPKSLHPKARKLIPELPDNAVLVYPSEVLERIEQYSVAPPKSCRPNGNNKSSGSKGGDKSGKK